MPSGATWAGCFTPWRCRPAPPNDASILTGGWKRPTRLQERNPRDCEMSDIKAWIDNEVKSNDVVLFMKGTPSFPQCGFSSQVVQILDYLGVDYKGINV